MRAVAAPMGAFLALVVAPMHAASANPVQKVIQLLSDLQSKVIQEGEAAQKSYEEYSEWCESRSKDLAYEVKTATAEAEHLKASIEKATSSIASLTAEVEALSGKIATSTADLKAATHIREREEADFAASESELMEVISSLERAVGILEREARRGSTAMLQFRGATGVLQALSSLVDASMLGAQDAKRLTALVQGSQQDEDSSDALGAPDPSAYNSHSGSIIETLEDLLDKAKEHLDSARGKETAAKHNFLLLKQALEDELKFGGQDMSKAKKNLAGQQEARATAGSDLAMTTKGISEDQKALGSTKQDCTMRAQDFEAATKSRGEELKAIAAAKDAITEMTSGASSLTYSFSQQSFLQISQVGASGIATSADLANFEAVRFVRNLARKQHSEALAQLARRMASVMRMGAAAGEDPFSKVKGLIREMLERLEKDSQIDASHKAYCDKELGETLQKKADNEAEVEKLSTKIDSMTAQSAQLKEQVAATQKALAELAKSQSEATALRREEKAQFMKSKPEMEAGLEGVKMGLKILREYYARDDKAHEAAEGTGSSVIGLLEVVESDFSKMLAEMSATEANSQASYEQETKENEIEKATKESDVQYKTKEYKQLDAAVAEATSDREGIQAELSAVLEYKSHLQQICTAKPETYAERKARREAELAGLKEALSILEGQAVLLLQRQRGLRRTRRGAARLAPRA